MLAPIFTKNRKIMFREISKIFVFALMIILLAIVMLAILLIVGDSVREFFNDIGIRWSLFGGEGILLPIHLTWLG